MDKKLEKQFELNFTKLAGGIFRYAYFKVSDYELAQDLTQETFIKYWKVLSEGKKIGNHKALLYFIAKGLVIDYYRKKKRTKGVSIESVDERLLSVSDSVEETLYQKQELEQVYATIKKLKKDYQDILFLHYVEDLSVKEIAFIQNKQENAIRAFLHRALKALKKKL